MRLQPKILRIESFAEWQYVLSHPVTVKINASHGLDEVRIEGYEGSVDSDLIAELVYELYLKKQHSKEEAKAAKLVGVQLEEKIFKPLKKEISKLNFCSDSLYRMRNFLFRFYSSTEQSWKFRGDEYLLTHCFVAFAIREPN